MGTHFGVGALHLENPGSATTMCVCVCVCAVAVN